MSQAKLAQLKSLGLLPVFKLWSKWGRTVHRLHLGCSLLHWSPGGSLPKAQRKVWYPAPGGFQWDGALSFPFIPLNVCISCTIEDCMGSGEVAVVPCCWGRAGKTNRELLCSGSLCGSCCPAVSLGHYQIQDQGQGTLEKAPSVAKTWRAQFKAPLLSRSKTQPGRTLTLKVSMTHDDGFETLHG